MANDNRLELVIEIDGKQAVASVKGVNKSLDDLERQAASAGKKASVGIDGMTASMTKAVVAGNAIYDIAKKAFSALKDFTLGAIKLQDDMGKTAQKLGLSVKEFSEFRHVAELSDMTVEGLGTSIGMLSKNMMEAAQGGREYRRNFAMIGVDIKTADGALRSAASVIEDVADKFAGMPDGATKTALALNLLGRSGKEMIPFLNQGGEAIRSAREEAHKLGRTIDEETFRAAERFNDNVTRLKGGLEGLSFALAKELLPKLNDLVDRMVRWARDGGVDRLASQIKDVAEWIKNLGMWIVSYSVVAGLIKIASAVRNLALAVGSLNAAMLANPWTLAAVGIATFGYAMWKEYEKIGKTTDALKGLNREAALFNELKSGKNIKELRKLGYSDEEMRFALTKGRELPESPLASPFGRVTGLGYDSGDAGTGIDLADADKIEKFIRDANKAAREFYTSAQESLLLPITKETTEAQRIIEKLTTYVDEQGVEQKIKLTAEARENIERGLQLRIQKLQEETAQKKVKQDEDAAVKALELAARNYERRRDYERALADQAYEFARQSTEYQIEQAAVRRDAELRKLERSSVTGISYGPEEIARKKAVDAQRADIEIEYIKQVHQVKLTLFDMETERLIEQANLQKEILHNFGIEDSRIDRQIAKIREQRNQQRGWLDEQAEASVDEARENAAARQMQIVRDEQQKTFDNFKRLSEGVFDALLTKSGNVFSAIGNIFKNAMLTAIKEIVTSHVARMLVQLFGGMRAGAGGAASAAGGSGGGMAGMLGGFGALMGGGFGGGGNGASSLIPAGTGASGGGMGGLLNYAGAGSGFKSFFGLGEKIIPNPLGLGSSSAPFSSLSFGGKMGALASSPAAMMGGGMLGLAGVQRGGWSGMAMGSGGFALTGFGLAKMLFPKMAAAGPWGALIGAGVGAAIGLASLLRESPEEKVRKKVKAVYGVDIQAKGVRQQIVQIAQQSYGSNIDMAIRSVQVQDLIRLYAMTTGQNTGNLPKQMTSAALIQSGGSLRQQVQYVNGQAVAGSGGLIPALHRGIDFVPRDMFAFLQRGERVTPAAQNKPLPGANLDQSDRGQPLSVDVTMPAINIAIPGFTDGVVNAMGKNPKKVQIAAVAATKSNFRRRELLAMQISPGTLIS